VWRAEVISESLLRDRSHTQNIRRKESKEVEEKKQKNRHSLKGLVFLFFAIFFFIYLVGYKFCLSIIPLLSSRKPTSCICVGDYPFLPNFVFLGVWFLLIHPSQGVL